MAETIPATTEFVSPEDVATFVSPEDVATEIVKLFSEYLPGGIYADKGEDGHEVVLISRGQETAGIFLITVQRAEIKVAGDQS